MHDDGALSDPVLGTLIADRFRVGSILGRGGMGVVYGAKDEQSGRAVALKLLPANRGADPEEARTITSRFERETEVLAAMRHPGIVEYLGGGLLPDGSRYLAMEFLEGETLLSRARRAPLRVEEVLSIGEQAAEALAYAHHIGVVHRDLKPANLFLCQKDTLRLKLIDFGIARFLDDRRRLTRAGGFIGTPAYMAPEQLRGEAQIDGRADLYSLGVSLYEAMSRRLPIEAPDTISLLLKVLSERPRPIRDLCPDVPPALERIFVRALAKTPKERFFGAEEMADSFRAARKTPAKKEQSTRVTRALGASDGPPPASLRSATPSKRPPPASLRSATPSKPGLEGVGAKPPGEASGLEGVVSRRRTGGDLTRGPLENETNAQSARGEGGELPPSEATQRVELPPMREEDLLLELEEEYLPPPPEEEEASETFREKFQGIGETQHLASLPEENPEILETFRENFDTLFPGGLEDVPTQVRAQVMGELRRVIVVVVEGSMGRRTPEAAFDRAQKALLETGGRVERIYDGRVVALFGASHTYGDEARRAVLGALGGASKDVRIGVGSGRVLSSDDARSGGAVPQATALVARARPGGVLISPETFRRTRGLFDVEPFGKDAYRVLAERRHGVLIGTRSLLGVETPTVGRQKEIEALRGALAEVFRTRSPRLALVLGEAGMGKSRLKFEVRLALEENKQEPLYLESFGDPIRNQTPYALLGSALKTLSTIRAGDSTELRLQKLNKMVARVCSIPPGQAEGDQTDPEFLKTLSAQELVELLGAALGIELPQSQLLARLRVNPHGFREKTEEAFVTFFTGAARSLPVVLILEDLHWADEATLAVLDRLLSQPRLPLLLMCTARTSLLEEHPQLFARHSCLRLQLAPLDRTALGWFLREFWGGEPPEALISFLQDATGGNPFLIEELLAALRDEQVLVPGVSGGFSLARPLSDAPVPAGAEALLQARLDHLPVEEKELLKRASIFGRVFWLEGLGVLGIPEAGALLERLRSKEFVSLRSESRIENTREYVFRHALLYDVAYGLLPEQDRQALHAQAAAWLEEVGEEDFSTLARHYQLAGQEEAAAALYTRAAYRAAAEYAVEPALGAIRHARQLERDARVLFDLLLLEEDLYFWRGDRAEDRRVLEELSELCARQDERARLSLAYREGRYFNRTGENARAEDVSRAAIELAHELGDTQSELLALGELTWSVLNLGRYDEGIALARQGIPVARSLKRQDQLALLLILIGFGHARRGELGLCARYTREGLTNSRAAGDRRLEAMALGNLGSNFVTLGCYAEAEHYLRQAVHLAELTQNALSLSFGWLNLGNALSLQGRFEEGEEALTQAFQIAERIGHPELPGYVRCYLAHLYLLRNRPKDPAHALELTDQVHTSTQSVNEQVNAYAYLWRARALLLLGDIPQALRAIEAALKIQQELGSLEEEEEEILYTHYLVLSALGRSGDAWSALARANAFVEARAQRVGDPTYRESYLKSSLAAVTIREAWSAQKG